MLMFCSAAGKRDGETGREVLRTAQSIFHWNVFPPFLAFNS